MGLAHCLRGKEHRVKQRLEFPTFANVAVLDGTMPHHTREHSQILTPCFQLLLYLEGYQKFYVDDLMFDIDAGQGTDRHPQILLLNRTRQCTLRTVASHGEQVLRKVKVSVPTSWVKDMNLSSRSKELRTFAEEHLNACIWEASKDIQQLGEQIISPPDSCQSLAMPELIELFRTGKGIELLAQACLEMFGNHHLNQQYGSGQMLRHTDKVRDYIMENLQKDLTIEHISKETGASKRSIQRNFKDRFGLTVFDFIRRQRLEKARQAIEQEGYSVSQAAFIAGYNNPSSFTNAFKRLYGTPPKIWRSR